MKLLLLVIMAICQASFAENNGWISPSVFTCATDGGCNIGTRSGTTLRPQEVQVKGRIMVGTIDPGFPAPSIQTNDGTAQSNFMAHSAGIAQIGIQDTSLGVGDGAFKWEKSPGSKVFQLMGPDNSTAINFDNSNPGTFDIYASSPGTFNLGTDANRWLAGYFSGLVRIGSNADLPGATDRLFVSSTDPSGVSATLQNEDSSSNVFQALHNDLSNGLQITVHGSADSSSSPFSGPNTATIELSGPDATAALNIATDQGSIIFYAGGTDSAHNVMFLDHSGSVTIGSPDNPQQHYVAGSITFTGTGVMIGNLNFPDSGFIFSDTGDIFLRTAGTNRMNFGGQLIMEPTTDIMVDGDGLANIGTRNDQGTDGFRFGKGYFSKQISVGPSQGLGTPDGTINATVLSSNASAGNWNWTDSGTSARFWVHGSTFATSGINVANQAVIDSDTTNGILINPTAGSLVLGAANVARISISASGNINLPGFATNSVLMTDGGSNITTGTISNANVNAAAAIARSKLASGNANSVAFNNGSGVLTDNTSLLYTAGSQILRLNANGNIILGAGGSAAFGAVSGSMQALNAGINDSSTTAGDIVGIAAYTNDGTNNKRVALFSDQTNGTVGIAMAASSGAPVFKFIDSFSGAVGAQWDTNEDWKFFGNVDAGTVGKGFRVAEGSNAKQGQATLSGGTVVVSTTAVTANSRIFLTCNDPNGGTPGAEYVSTRTAATSFTITSTSGADTCKVAWEIFEPG